MAGKVTEVWETTTGGTVYVNVRDPRNPDGWTRKKVGGKGSKRITLTDEEREFNQDLVQFENAHLDPFSNGTLIRVSPKDAPRGDNEKTDEQLIALLTVDSDEAFEAALQGIQSEIVVRRLLELSKTHTTMMRHDAVQNLVDDRYHIGKTSRVVREIQDDDRRYSEADL